MAAERDFNEVLDAIFLSEENLHKESYTEGLKAGKEAGNPEGYHLGYHKGAELGRELGYYSGIINHHIEYNNNSETKYPEKIVTQLIKVKGLLDDFPRCNSEDHDILQMVENIRAHYKKIAYMESTIVKVRQHLDSIISYLNPLLPLANCHMVEFFARNHWEKLLPTGLRQVLEEWELNDAVDRFWRAADELKPVDSCVLSTWVQAARSHCVSDKEEYCISTQHLQSLIGSWGGEVKPEIKVKEFMSTKKSYEVQTMSRLVASLYDASGSNCCVEVGGGRGPLLVALSLGYGVRSITVECDERTFNGAVERIKIIQKQWHAIAKKLNYDEGKIARADVNKDLHKFVKTFVTRDTDMSGVVKQEFKDIDEVKLLLTGLHTCGNLGPDSLRIFTNQSSTAAVFNVPCCYHLLSEGLDVDMFDVFQKNYGSGEVAEGFPMSEHLKGFNLGRNARMLAAQSINRVVNLRQLPSKSLLYRAILQEIINKYLPEKAISEGKLKKITPKCNTFEEYFKMADSTLKLNIFCELSKNDLSGIHKDIDFKWKKIVLFYLLRLCLAQVIESVILLDRLLYLMENGISKVYLVKLFDPVLSPRCHGIVAVR